MMEDMYSNIDSTAHSQYS